MYREHEFGFDFYRKYIKTKSKSELIRINEKGIGTKGTYLLFKRREMIEMQEYKKA